MTNRKCMFFALALLAATFGARQSAAAEFIVAQNDLIQFTEQAFIQNVFGNQRSFAAARKQSDEALQVQIDFVENAVTLSKDQRDKLELAGHADISRFFNEYEKVKRGMTFGGIPRDEWQQVWQRTQPLSTRYQAGLHGSHSLFRKTINATLGPEQRESFESMKRDRNVAIYIDNIRMTLSMLDRKVPLMRRQRQEITDLLIDQTEPPEFYGQASMHFYVVMGQMANLREGDLKKVFNDKEWKVVDAMLRQAKAMERTLKLQREALEQ